MAKIIGVTIAWILVLMLGFAGLMTQQTFMMAACFVAWTPLAVVFGWVLRASNIRIVAQRMEPAPIQRVKPVNDVQRRERRISS